MKIPTLPFTVTDWSQVDATTPSRRKRECVLAHT